VSLRGGDVDLGELRPTVNATVSGRVVIEGLGFEEPDDWDPYVLSRETDFGTQRYSEVDADGSFVLTGLPPGLHMLSFPAAAVLPENWYVASISSGSRDVLRHGLEVGGAVAPIQVTLRSDKGRVEGRVLGRDERPAPDAIVVLIPPPGRRGPFARFPATQADHRGVFRLDAPPGDYRLLAIDGTERAGSWEAPDFLGRHETRARPITVDPSSRVLIDAEFTPISD
jgi:hypothetical protein